MNIVFFGSSDFAVESLRALLNTPHALLAVITQPDRQKGRHLILSGTPVKVYAKKYNLPVFQPKSVREIEVQSLLKSFKADLFIVVSFGQILTKEILEIPKLFCLNLHASVLPRWRGAAPVNWAIMSADKESGVSIIKMNEFMDRGDIILTKSVNIEEDDTAVSLTQKLSRLGAEALLEAVRLVENGDVQFIPQDNSLATIAPKLKKENGLIEWQDTAQNIHNKVRGLLPWPCAYTYYKGKILRLLKAKIVDVDYENKKERIAGKILTIEKQKGIVVATGFGNLLIEELQREGKRPLPAYDFFLGARLEIGGMLG